MSHAIRQFVVRFPFSGDVYVRTQQQIFVRRTVLAMSGKSPMAISWHLCERAAC